MPRTGWYQARQQGNRPYCSVIRLENTGRLNTLSGSLTVRCYSNRWSVFKLIFCIVYFPTYLQSDYWRDSWEANSGLQDVCFSVESPPRDQVTLSHFGTVVGHPTGKPISIMNPHTTSLTFIVHKIPMINMKEVDLSFPCVNGGLVG